MNRNAALGLAAAAMTIASPAAAQSALGDWSGTLEVTPQARLPLVVHIRQGEGGTLLGTMDSPSQGANGIVLADIAASDGKLTFTVPQIAGGYQGTWDPAAKAWKGRWSQNGMTWPLDLAAGAPATAPRPAPPPLPADWRPPVDAAIAEVLAARNAPRPGQGIVAGVLDPSGRRVVSGGLGAGAGFDGKTLFEIGSISKVFTALLLADMANKGEVSLDDPAAKYLPAGHRMPQRGSRPITLRDLSTHRSGLPRLPSNLAPADAEDPYADYTEAQMLAFLDGYQLTRDVGAQAEYSNLAVGLLGYLLGRAANKDYETLLRERITGPLGMADTRVALGSGQLAPAFDMYMRPAKPWHLATLVGAGGIRSNADDMLTFAAAVLDPNSPIAAAVKTALGVREAGDAPQVEQALGWQVVHPQPGRDLLLHNGGTGGFRSALIIEPAKKSAAVVLINSAAEPSATDLAVHLLIGAPFAPTPPLPAAPPKPLARTEVTLPAADLERVVGRYQFPNFVVAVTFENGTMQARNETVPGAVAYSIFPEAPLQFFWRIVDAQLRFTADAAGKVVAAELTQDGQTFAGTRIEP